MQLVDTAAKFQSSVRVFCNGREADARSPMELLMLVATQGTALRVVAEGGDAEAAANAMIELVEGGFGEA